MQPSDKALVPFVSVDNMMRLVHHVGVEKMITQIAAQIESDFKRWESFDKTPAHPGPLAAWRDRADADIGRRGLRVQIRQRPPQEHVRGVCRPSPPLACWRMFTPVTPPC